MLTIDITYAVIIDLFMHLYYMFYGYIKYHFVECSKFMHIVTLNKFAEIGSNKRMLLAQNPTAFFVESMMGGVYIGFAIILIFSVAANIDPAWQALIMGLSFGIALTLVVFAGADLFTGHTMYMAISFLKKRSSLKDLAKVWIASWSFNFIGSVLLALIFLAGGGGVLLSGGEDLLIQIASYKMNSDAIELVARGALCNWLVCLALWMAARTESDSAKAIVIFWCLFAFIASGYEHSVANMTLLTIALVSNASEAISFSGLIHNLLWVSCGNIVGGSFFMAYGYWIASGEDKKLVN